MEGGVYPSVNNLYELPTYFNLIWCKKTCHILFDIALKSSIPSIQSPKSKIHHVFLLKAQYQSLQNSYFGDISPYRSDLSHTNIILTFFFLRDFTIVRGNGHASGFDDRYKVRSLFIASRTLYLHSIGYFRFTNCCKKANKNRMPWHSETWLDIDCLLVSQ